MAKKTVGFVASLLLVPAILKEIPKEIKLKCEDFVEDVRDEIDTRKDKVLNLPKG